METRDKLNSEDGYKEIISQKETFISNRIEKIKKLEEAEDSGIQLFNRPNLEAIEYTLDTILNYRYDNLIASYSLGIDIKEIKPHYDSIIPYMEKRWRKINGYVQMVWMLSIGIMLDVKDEEFTRLAEIVARDNPNDYLVDFLIHYRIPSWEIKSDTFMWKSPYQSTKEIIALGKTDRAAGLERLKKYLSKEWYRGHSSAGWHDSHKSKWNIHSGYWSFESGALVKILGLDDSTLKGAKYYPYDMVHWREE